MKKIITILMIVGMTACKSTLPIATNPDKSTFNSGTIGSVKGTDKLPLSDSGSIYKNDTIVMKKDTSQHHFSSL